MHSPDDQTLGFDHVLRIMGLIQVAPEKTTPVSVVSLDGADHLLANTQADLDFVISVAAAFVNRYACPQD